MENQKLETSVGVAEEPVFYFTCPWCGKQGNCAIKDVVEDGVVFCKSCEQPVMATPEQAAYLGWIKE